MKPFDPRITPARADLAAVHLRGQVEASHFVEGRKLQVANGRVALRRIPSGEASLETELRFGESFIAYEEKNGWIWGQAESDSYVGYARATRFGPFNGEATHRVTALGTPLLLAPDVKASARDILPMHALLRVLGEEGRFLRLAEGYVFSGHASPVDHAVPDWVTTTESFVGVPYVWGGVTPRGLDCSGLVQTALASARIRAPRDTDMMEDALGKSIPVDDELNGLQRGDLVFWKGHMGVLLDAKRLIHANAFHMQVRVEPLRFARDRIAASDGPIRTIKRLS